MKFGIFGGARQKRGLADTDSPTGYRVGSNAISRRRRWFFAALHDRASFYRSRRGFCVAQPDDVPCGKDDDIAPRHRRNDPPWHNRFCWRNRRRHWILSPRRLDFGVDTCIATTNFTPSVSTWWMPTRLPSAWRLFGKAGSNMSCCRMRAAGLLAFVNSPKRLFSAVRGHRGCGAAVLPSGHRARRGAVRSVPASASDRTSGLRRQPQH